MIVSTPADAIPNFVKEDQVRDIMDSRTLEASSESNRLESPGEPITVLRFDMRLATASAIAGLCS